MGTPGHKLIQFPERKPGPGLMQEEESQFSNLGLVADYRTIRITATLIISSIHVFSSGSSHVLCHTCATATNN